MRRKLMLFTVGLALAAGFGAMHLSAQPAGMRPPQPGPAAAPPVQNRVVALGRLEPITEVIKVNGPAGQDAARLMEVRVAEGDWVERGTIIAVLDTRNRLAAALAQAQATLELRRAALLRTRIDLDNQEQQLLATMEQQAASRDRARWELDRLQTLQRSGLYREPALIDKRLALTQSDRIHQTAQLALDRNRARDEQGRRLDEATAEAELANADAAVDRARADLAMVEIRAPISGRILRRIGRNGEQISSDGIVEIGDTRVMMARVEVFEADIAGVTIGQPVRISARAFDGAIDARVERIGLKVNRQSVVGDDPATALDARIVEVLIRLDEAGSARVSGLTGLQVRAVFLPAGGAGS